MPGGNPGTVRLMRFVSGLVGLGLAVQAGEQIRRQLGALGHRQVHRLVQQLAGSVGHRAHLSKPERERNRGVHGRDVELDVMTTSELCGSVPIGYQREATCSSWRRAGHRRAERT